MSGRRIPGGRSVWLRAVIVTVILIWHTDAFNLDLRSPEVYHGPRGSYFGYSVSQHKNSMGCRVLVGAPKAPSEMNPDLQTPGALYDCQLYRSANCTQVGVDSSGNSRGGRGSFEYWEQKDNQWLGVSVDSRRQGNGSVVVCGHRWMNTRGNYFANGVCYELNGELEFQSSRKLLPLVNHHKQARYSYDAAGKLTLQQFDYAFGQAGASVHYTKSGESLLVGAPGVYGWTGAVVQYVETGVPYVLTTPSHMPIDSFVGYSVTSGYFFHDDRLYYVASAPRLEGVGKVFIFRGRFDIRLELQGAQLGSYFGASLCAVDLNGDGYEEILVGAPLYKAHRGEEGAVFVYINHLKGLLSPTLEPIMGSRAAWSRFGSAIASAGDIDDDGFNDVVVGAPYEDSGSGAIYIYNGAHHGISMFFSQRVTPRDFGMRMRGFGASLDAGMDMDDNAYPDVAVGAYGSDSAVVLLSRPVINIEAQIAFGPHQTHIDLQRLTCTVQGSHAPCLALYVAFRCTTKGPETIRIEYVLSADVLLTNQFLLPRGRIVQGNRLVARVSNVTTLVRDTIWQLKYHVAFDGNEKDLLTPVQFHLSYRLLEDPVERFLSPSLPILHASQETEQYASVTFKRDCGTDNLCTSDLDLSVQVVTPTGQLEVVNGHRDLLYIVCELVNRGEPAYLTEVHIQHQDTVKFVRVNKSDHDGHIVCIPLIGNYAADSDDLERSTLLCEVGHAILKGQMVNFTLALDTSSVDLGQGPVEISIVARSGSDVSENGATPTAPEVISIPVVTRSNLTVSCKSVPEQYQFNANNYNSNDTPPDPPEMHRLVHYYDILNIGPGALPYANLSLAIPSVVSNGNSVIIVDSVDLLSDGQSASAAGNCRHITSDASRMRMGNRTPSLSAALLKLLHVNGDSDPVQVSCHDTECQNYECEIGSMAPGDSLLLQVHLLLDLNSWLQITSFGSSGIGSEISIYVPDLSDAGVPKYDVYGVSTMLYPVGYHHRIVRRLPLWLLLLSVISGIIVLLLLSALLKRCGFFRRKEMEILRRMKLEMEENSANEQLLVTSGSEFQPTNTPYRNGTIGQNSTAKAVGKLEPVLEDDGIADEINSPTREAKNGSYVPIPLPTRASKRRWLPKKNKTDMDNVNSVISRLHSPKQSHTPLESGRNKYTTGTPPNGIMLNSPEPKRAPLNGLNLTYTVPKNDPTQGSSCNPAFELLESPGEAPAAPGNDAELLGAYFIPTVPDYSNSFLDNNNREFGVGQGAVSPGEDRCSPSDIEVANYLHTPPPCYYFPAQDINQQAAQYLVPVPSVGVTDT